MDQAEKTNLVQPTPSRTLRILASGYNASKYTYNHTLNGNVYFLTFNTQDDAKEAYDKLKEDKVPVRYHVYSLFTKFDELMTDEQLTAKVKEVFKDEVFNITYLRVDVKDDTKTSHTGKVVIDRLEDCKTLLAYKDNTSTRLRFYRFDPKKAIKKNTNDTTFKKVVYKKNVKSQHTKKN